MSCHRPGRRYFTLRAAIALTASAAFPIAQQVVLIEDPELRVSDPQVRAASLEDRATHITQSHEMKTGESLLATLSAGTGFWGRSVQLSFRFEGNTLVSAEASGAWWTDVGPPFQGEMDGRQGQVTVSAVDLSSVDSLAIQFDITFGEKEEKIGGVLSLDLRLPSARRVLTTEGFGSAVALSGDLAVVSAPRADDGRGHVGAAHVFERIGKEWVPRSTLWSESEERSGYGTEVAASGRTVVVAARYEHVRPGGIGALYVYEEDESGWQRSDVLVAPRDGPRLMLGGPLALDGDTLLACARGIDDAGSVLVFERTDGAWKLAGRIACPDDNGEGFAQSVALSGSNALVGRILERPQFQEAGEVFHFVRLEGGWELTGKLPQVDADALDKFGHDVALADGRAIVGAPLDPHTGSYSGSAHLYRLVEGSWHEPERFGPGLSGDRDNFAWDVEADEGWGEGPVLVAGSHRNRVVVFHDAGREWSVDGVFELPPEDWSLFRRAHGFGQHVAVSGSTVLVGASGYPVRPGIPATGAVFVYERGESGWTQNARLTSSP